MVLIEAETAELDLAAPGREGCGDGNCHIEALGCELEDSRFVEHLGHDTKLIELLDGAVGADVALEVCLIRPHTDQVERQRTSTAPY
jgi:hypothetical protein